MVAMRNACSRETLPFNTTRSAGGSAPCTIWPTRKALRARAQDCGHRIGWPRIRNRSNCASRFVVQPERAVHPQVVGIGARGLRRFTVAPFTALAEFQPRRLVHAEAA